MNERIFNKHLTKQNHQIKHLAIIMDGNARWAKENKVAKAQGHKKGAENARDLLQAAMELNIPYLTLYSFSSENWQRPPAEVSVLINLLAFYLEREISAINKNGIRLKIIGKLDKLSDKLQKTIANAVKITQHNEKMTLCVAFSYGSRAEIIDACNQIIKDQKHDITEEQFKNYLYDPQMPDVDLLIRTSGMQRISNFLLWQSAYAELYFTSEYWPDFKKDDLLLAIEDYSMRIRKFGGR